MKRHFKSLLPCLFGFILIAGSCNKESEFYSMDDFHLIEKIDTHTHINTNSPLVIEQGLTDNMRVVTINTDAWDGQSISDQQVIALELKNRFPDRFEYATTFSMEGWEDAETWVENTIAYLEKSFANGAIGVKVWKSIGMTYKDENDNFIMIDHPQFDPVISYIEEQAQPLLGHLGEPKNCWLPLDEMTTNNDREYFENNPQYHLYLHPENPSYEEIIQATNNRLDKHPNLDYVGIHLGSMEWSIEMMAEHLDRYPRMVLDMAHRIPHLQHHSQQDRDKLRNFFIEYQDQLIYSTDLQHYIDSDPEEINDLTHSTWIGDWEFFVTDHTMEVWQVDGSFQGLKLPREVVDKLYRKNAQRWWFTGSEL